MMTRWFFCLLPALFPCGVGAEVSPSPGPKDSQIQVVDYDPDQVVRLATAPGYVLVVELSPDERIETIAMGSAEAWQVTSNRRGNLLFVKQDPGASDTNMSVTSDLRRYTFRMTPDQAGEANPPYSVRFRYSGIDTAPHLALEAKPKAYRITGARALRPVEMWDDGQATSIRWPDNAPLPAIYTVNGSGDEAIVNGAMRGRFFVVDAVASAMRFRLGRSVATATRLSAGKHR